MELIDVVMTTVVMVLLVGATALVSSAFERDFRKWLWIGFAEHAFCGAFLLLYTRVILGGGDAVLYEDTGKWLADLMDRNFDFMGPEVTALLFQRPNYLEGIVYGGGRENTGSMHAIAAWLIYLLQGSTYAASMFVAGLAFFGAVAIYAACRDASPSTPRDRLFFATVLFPSVAFWTSAFHKESFAVIGTGLVMHGWRGFYQRKWLRFLLVGPLGLVVLYLFRRPVLIPLGLGIAGYFLIDRLRRTRGEQMAVMGPLFVVVTMVVLMVGTVAVSRLVPGLGVAQLGETIAAQQSGWANAGTAGDSTFASGDEPLTLTGQLLRLPYGLVNALFRPQLFDVHNVPTLISAIEMTAITVFVVRVFRQNGFAGVVTRVQREPFLFFCAAISLVGCAFIGLVTLNFGSLARYRVPFLPFYGALVAVLLSSPVMASAARPVVASKTPERRARLGPRMTVRKSSTG